MGKACLETTSSRGTLFYVVVNTRHRHQCFGPRSQSESYEVECYVRVMVVNETIEGHRRTSSDPSNSDTNTLRVA